MERRTHSPSATTWRLVGRQLHIARAGRMAADSQLVVGALSSMASAVSVAAILHPLDVVKTIHIREGPAAFKVTEEGKDGSKSERIRSWTAVQNLVHKRGVRAAWSGIGLSSCATALSWGIFRYTYDTIRRHSAQRWPQTHIRHAIAGSAASAITIFLTHPLFTAKSNVALHLLDDEKADVKSTTGRDQFRRRPTMFKPVVDIYSRGGIRALYKGLDTMLLGIPNNTIQMVLYEKMKQLLPVETPRAKTALGKRYQRLPVTLQSSLKHAAWSVISKAGATGITYPLHVIRLYQQHPLPDMDASGPWTTAQHLVRAQGIGSLYRGFGIHMQKSLIQNAMVFVLFEKLQDQWLAYRRSKLPTDNGSDNIRLSTPPSLDLKYLMRRISTIPQDQRWESGQPFTVLRRTGSIVPSLTTVRRRPSNQDSV